MTARRRGFPRLPVAAALLVAFLLASCQAGDGVSATSAQHGDGWNTVQSQVLESNCVVCHSGAAAPMGLQLTSDQYDPIVTNGRASGELPGYKIVNPTNSTESYIFMKITGDPRIQGERMPRGKPPLPGMSIARIGTWIDAGAPRVRPGGGTGNAPPAPTWVSIQAEVLQGRCVMCHSGPNAPMGLSWEASQYGAIVTDGRMNSAGTFKIVNPGNKATSYLYLKITGDALAGAQMPLAGPYLPQTTIDVIGQWIDAGAPLGDVPAPLPDPPPPPPSGGAPVASWQYIQATVLQPKCVMCHSGPTPPQGLSWEAGMYDVVVTAQKKDASGTWTIVKPGDHANSYLYMKIAGDPRIGGSRMPLVGGPLAPDVIALIAQWIDVGAPLGDGTAPPPTEPPPPAYPVGSWLYVQAQVFQVCTMCHTYQPAPPYGSPPKGLVLEPDNYSGVVNDAFIRPYRRSDSEIWRRITETDPDKRMPFGLPPLTSTQIEIVGAWIDAGAPDTLP